jgi:hypothetical protein
MRRPVLIAATLALVLPATARAEDVACGWSPADTNVPNGSIFMSRGSGPIKAVIDAVGEYRTHSGISHGNGWYTHSTTFQANQRDWADSETSCGVFGDYCCQGPLKGFELQNGYPGAGQIKGGALYKYYYSNNGPGYGGSANYGDTAFIYYQRSLDANWAVTTAGADIANWLWSRSNYAYVTSRVDGNSGFYRTGFTGVTPYTQYLFYQYRDLQNINYGNVPWDYGNVCSTELAYAQQQAKGQVINNYRSYYGAGPANSYNHDRLVNGLNQLYNAVSSECSGGLGFWTGIGVGLTCWEDICDDAGRQVSNCFADGINGHCYNDSDRWAQIRDWQWQGGPVDSNGYAITVSISPDNLGGWSGWGYGQPSHSVWGRDGSQQVYWNSGGSVYGCWF